MSGSRRIDPPVGGRGSILAVFAGVLYYVTGASWPVYLGRFRARARAPRLFAAPPGSLDFDFENGTRGCGFRAGRRPANAGTTRAARRNRCDAETKVLPSFSLLNNNQLMPAASVVALKIRLADGYCFLFSL